MKLNKYISGALFTAIVGMATSCSETEVPVNNEDADMVDITVNFVTEDAVGTRAAVSDDFEPLISTGYKIDVLVYEVYDADSNELLKAYGKGAGLGCPSGFTVGEGQNAIGFTAGEKKTIVLKVNKDRNYRIACWAQSSATNAYTTKNGLQNVTVSYEGAVNNDELRDAFCKTSEAFSGSITTPVEVVLQRPFAQLNVGTTGADFRVSAKIPGGTYYTYSKIELTGVSNSINVYTDEIGAPSDNKVTFEYNAIPAYWNKQSIPTEENLNLLDKGSEKEEFLLVDLDKDGEYKPFKTNYSTMTKNGKYLTETFKYMSMCYVLVPGSKVATKADGDATTGSSLGSVTLYFAGDPKGEETTGVNSTWTLTSVPVARNYRTNILGGLKYIDPKTVPGYDEEHPWNPPTDPDDPDFYPPTDPDDPGYIPEVVPTDPTDPDDPENPDDPDGPTPTPVYPIPDDPNTLFNAANVEVTISVEYFGDKSTPDYGNNWIYVENSENKSENN